MWTYKKLQLEKGNALTYAIILPDNFDSKKEYIALLALPPGGQGKFMVELGLNDYWAKEAKKRGWIVISPIAPQGGFSGGTNMKELCEHLLGQFKIKDEKFHLSGNSNGGLSSFRVALKYPQYFKSITVLAGYTRDFDKLERIKHIPINLFVGEKDLGWLRPMEKMKQALQSMNAKVSWYVIANEGHEIRSLFNNPKVFGWRSFDTTAYHNNKQLVILTF